MLINPKLCVDSCSGNTVLNQLAINPTAAHLQFSLESLTPICASLKRFKGCFQPVLFSSSSRIVALLFRHSSQLQELDLGDYFPLCSTLQLLHEQQQREPNGATGVNSSEKLGLIQWTLDAPFHGILFFVSVSIDLNNYKIIFLFQVH